MHTGSETNPNNTNGATNEHEQTKLIFLLHVYPNTCLHVFPGLSRFSLPRFSLALNYPEILPFSLFQYTSECFYSLNPKYARSANEPRVFPLFTSFPGSVPLSPSPTNPEAQSLTESFSELLTGYQHQWKKNVSVGFSEPTLQKPL